MDIQVEIQQLKHDLDEIKDVNLIHAIKAYLLMPVIKKIKSK